MIPNNREVASLSRLPGNSAISPSQQLEMELAKDRWDARNIPGLQYAPHTCLYFIDFLCVPEVFRPLVKEYARFLLGSGRSAGTLYHHIHYLGHFFTFFVQIFPDARTLRDLTEQDVTAFVLHLKTTTNARGGKNSERKIGERIHCLEGLLSYLERIQSPIRPSAPTPRVIWPHHYPHWEKSPSERVKYIPQTVLKQLDAALQHLEPVYIPIVILLRASGWRISDVLYLKIDTCLEQDKNRYKLIGDIQKTRILGHKIPITQDVAAVVLTQIEWVKQHYTLEENPQSWLFPASKQQYGRPSQRFSRGDPRPARPVWDALNRLARKYSIRDDHEHIFHFKLHAFRHTKAVELLNAGMSLVMVQQWMAHASPEMTLIYAKILDETPCVLNGRRPCSKVLSSSTRASQSLYREKNCCP
jgi:integrase